MTPNCSHLHDAVRNNFRFSAEVNHRQEDKAIEQAKDMHTVTSTAVRGVMVCMCASK